MHLKKTVAPTLDTSFLESAKKALDITHTAHDALLARHVKAAYDLCERMTGRTLLRSTWQLTLRQDEIGGEIWLPKPPLISVSSVEIFDEDDTATTVPTTNYTTVGTDPAQLVPRNNGWQDSNGNYIENYEQALRITFLAGYGSVEQKVPEPIVHAIISLVQGFYDGAGTTLPSDVKYATLEAQAVSLLHDYLYDYY